MYFSHINVPEQKKISLLCDAHSPYPTECCLLQKDKLAVLGLWRNCMLISNTVFSWNLNHWTTRDVQFFFFSFLFGSIQQNAKLPHPGIKPMAPVVKAWNCIIWHFVKAHPNVISVTHQSHLCYPLYFLHFRSILLIFFSSLHFSPPSIFSTSSSPV